MLLPTLMLHVAASCADGRVETLAHIGSAVHPRDGRTQEALLDCADHAMYAVKRAG